MFHMSKDFEAMKAGFLGGIHNHGPLSRKYKVLGWQRNQPMVVKLIL